MMFLFAITLLTLLTRASENNSYVECYTDADCQDIHDKPYCYIGTCTTRCPPGYKQRNFGKEPTFRCTCDIGKGFKPNGYFPKYPSIPKCKCNRSYCKVTVYAAGVGYTDGLIPTGLPPNCKIKSGEIPGIATEFTFYMVIGTMIIFAFINCRSASGVIYDFHRYIALYVVASIAVIVFVQTVTPFTAGFTRTMGFGVIIHNSAEWNFLLRLHYGKQASVRNCTNMCVMLYYVLLLIAMVILPLEALLYVAMIQGGFLDWALVFYVFVAKVKEEPNWQPVCNSCFSTSTSRFQCQYGFAAIFHLTTVEVLFVGFAMNNPILIGIGSVLLVPTFLAYTFWAYGEDRLSVLCGPSLVMNYKLKHDGDNTADVTLVPFEHTSRAVDILWQGLVGGQAHVIQKENVTTDAGGDANETEKLIDEPASPVDVEDCENFKNGIHEQVAKCPCCKCCSCFSGCWTWIPCYWGLAFLIVVFNATIIIYAPTYLPRWSNDCISGYEYGAW